MVPWLDRKLQVSGAGKWVSLGCFLLFSPSVHSRGSCLSRPRTTGSVLDFPGLWLKQAAPHSSLGDHVRPLYVAGAVGSWHPAGVGPCGSFLKAGRRAGVGFTAWQEICCSGVRKTCSVYFESLVPLVASFKPSPSPPLMFHSTSPVIKPEEQGG